MPPFREASLYQNKISDPNFLPYFSSKATGDVLRKAANRRPDIQFEVIAGHTHHAAQVHITDNLKVQVQHAEYRSPSFKEILV